MFHPLLHEELSPKFEEPQHHRAGLTPFGFAHFGEPVKLVIVVGKRAATNPIDAQEVEVRPVLGGA